MLSQFTGVFSITIVTTIGLLAVLLPVQYISNGEDGVSSSSCPLGYGMAEASAELDNLNEDTPAQKAHIFYNARVWTGDAKRPWAEAFSVAPNGRIKHIGLTAQVLGLSWPTSLRLWLFGAPPTAVNLRGKFVVPGFIDSHVHLIQGGYSLSRVYMEGVTTKEGFVAAVKEAADAAPPGSWILGGIWGEQNWGGELPHRSWIDSVSPHHPVLLTRMCGHMALANSRALEAAGIGRGAADPDGGQIKKDASGEPTGILTETAMKLVAQLLPKPTAAEDMVALQNAARYLLSKGITTVHDMGPPFDGEAAWRIMENTYLPAADSGALPIRILAYMALNTLNRTADFVKAKGHSHPSGRLFWGSVKEFADGSLGSRTALMQEPYSDRPDTSGVAVMDYGELQALIGQAHAKQLQLAVHAIGDKAIAEVVRMFGEVLGGSSSGSPGGALRHRVEHAQHLPGVRSAQDMQRLGLTAVINPLHLLHDVQLMKERLGKQRAGPQHGFAYQTLQKAGVHLASGSDWPVVAAEPLLGIYAAVNRKHPNSTTGWYAAEEGLSPEAALRAHTADAAWAGHLEWQVGSLREGMHADFVVLSANPLKATGVADVLQTYVDGERVFGSANLC
ncbi:hypothetical protein WJX72_010387 [[Myrmecia] bisecta]|uniref:Amidohydrolase 3 domain-containing protein n=1 Tax=[Myrmecia] bisecta TaxID=41462 RepID=A0AAW1PA33_9CHLO